MELGVRTKIWIERGGEIALSTLRVQLLEAIDATGSLAAASRQMGWPYRRAWGKIREIEQSLGVRLIESEVGGYGGGGGSRLTDAARDYIRRYHLFTDGLKQITEERFRQAFGDLELPTPRNE